VLAFGWFHAITILHSYRNFERLVLRSTQAGHVIRGPELKEAVAPLLREPVLKPYVEVMMASWMAISPVNLRDKLQVNSRATRIVPIGRLIYRQAFLLALNGQSEEALQLFDQAVRVFPDYLAEARADLAQLDRDYPGRLSALSARAAGGITDSHGTRKIDK
ncbi:MAG TPA: Wzy polymerase domain-containing protein, partial [Burkholderiales bacterium]|nr:Wzy polymerase domain-containing protein [Burkholderiales bacterium]